MKQAICLVICLSALLSLSAAQEVQYPPEEVVQLPLPDCGKFVVCDEGLAIEITCQSGLYYNSATTLCDYPENIPECIEGTRAPIGSTLPVTTEVTVETTEITEGSTEDVSVTTLEHTTL